MFTRLPIFFCAGIFLLIFPIVLYAHGTGASLEKQIGAYTVDVGYSPPLIEVDDPVRFDFNLIKSDDRADVAFTDIWVRIEERNSVVFAGGIHKARLGETGMSYVFPGEGEYTLFVRFQNEGDSLAETSFPLIVEKGVGFGEEGFSLSPQLFIGVIGGLIIGLLPSLLKRKTT